MKRDPPVTVLMTVRNGEPFLKKTLDSILNQTFGDYRFLILDNASTDRSREIVRDARDARIDLVELERDLGQTAALNLGLRMAKTRFVARTDADDVSLPHRLDHQLRFLAQSPDVKLLGAWYEIIDEHSRVISVRRPFASHSEIVRAMMFRNQFAHSSVVYDRSAARSCGFYRSGYSHAQDFALWWEMALDHTTANLPEVLVRIRTHAGQTTRGLKQDFAREPYEVIGRVLRDRRLPRCAVSLRTSAKAYAELRYGAYLSAEGQALGAMVHAIRGLVTDPSLLNTKMGRYYLAKALLPNCLYEVLPRRAGRVGPPRWNRGYIGL
jgi:glycosyltransferase involved in cell wall biosynthesis